MLDDENDPFSQSPLEDPFAGSDLDSYVWSVLDDDVTDEVEEWNDICEHVEHKQVFVKPQSGGISAMGVGMNAGTGIEKVYCSKCDKTWHLDDRDQTSSVW